MIFVHSTQCFRLPGPSVSPYLQQVHASVSNHRLMCSISYPSTTSARLRQDGSLPASGVRTADAARGCHHDVTHPVQKIDVQPPTCRSREDPLRLAIRFWTARRSGCRQRSRVDVHLRVCVRDGCKYKLASNLFASYLSTTTHLRSVPHSLAAIMFRQFCKRKNETTQWVKRESKTHHLGVSKLKTRGSPASRIAASPPTVAC